MTATETFQLIGLFLIVVGQGLTVWQLRTNRNHKTAEFIIGINNQFFQNEGIIRMFYKVEYSRFTYSDEFHGSEDEIQLDNLIKHFDNLATLFKMNNLSIEDLGSFAYRYLIVFQNADVKEYLKFVDSWYKERGMRIDPFSNFKEIGKLIEREYYHESLDKRPFK